MALVRQRLSREPAVERLHLETRDVKLDADGSLWRIFHHNGFNGKYWTGSQPGQRFHDLMEQGRYALDPRTRREAYREATRILHEDKPWLELFQEVVIYGVSKRVSFKPRADYRLLAAEMTLTR